MSGIPAGETAYIRGDDGDALLSYRSFASVVGIIAALMSAVVLLPELAGVLFLLLERRPLPAIAAMILSAAFAAMIVMLIPATNVTIFEGASPAITIAQQSGVSFPTSTWIVVRTGWQADRAHPQVVLLPLRPQPLDMLDRASTSRGEAVEESLGRALIRKLFGKFARATSRTCASPGTATKPDGSSAAPTRLGRADVLDLASSADARSPRGGGAGGAGAWARSRKKCEE